MQWILRPNFGVWFIGFDARERGVWSLETLVFLHYP